MVDNAFLQGAAHGKWPRGPVYLGGPIDGTEDSEQDWRTTIKKGLEQSAISFYDPLEANAGETDPVVVVERNMVAMPLCTVALFCFPTPGQFGFGSPIEMWQFGLWETPMVVYTPSRLPHLYLRYMELERRVKVVHTLGAAFDAVVNLIVH